MTDLRRERFTLPTGVDLDVTLGGADDAPPVFFLHGFPESARTWRLQMEALAATHRVIAPDQRGFARSSKPPLVSDYTHDKPIGDLLALADALGIGRFALVGHDWGGAIAWGAALTQPSRIERLSIVNAPHPLIFQKTLFDDPVQRAGSQYIRAFRTPGIEKHIAGNLENFFDKTFAAHFSTEFSAEERAAYLDEWSQPGAIEAMLNWYRASAIVVPAVDETPERPAWLDAPFPVIAMPVLVVWGMRDTALTPSQLVGLDALCSDLKVVEVADAGHFITWEKPDAVTGALREFLA